MKYFSNVNSVSGLCLCLRDTALNINLSFDMCRWLDKGEDVEGVHEVLAKCWVTDRISNLVGT